MARGQDLDNFLTPGVFDCNSASVASTLLHRPTAVTTGFRLIVSQSGYGAMSYGTQIIIIGSGVGYPREFRRVYNGTPPNGTWSDWVQTPTRAEMDASRFSASIGTTGNDTFTVPNNYRGVLYVIDSSASRCGEYILYSTGGGVVGVKAISEANETTIDVSVLNKITITASTGSRRVLFISAANMISM